MCQAYLTAEFMENDPDSISVRINLVLQLEGTVILDRFGFRAQTERLDHIKRWPVNKRKGETIQTLW